MSKGSFEASHTSVSDAQPQRMFTKFPELPREIRLLIWEAALPGPRIVHLRSEFLTSCKFGTRRVRSDKTLACDCVKCEVYAPRKEIAEHREGACTTADVVEEAGNEDGGWHTDDDTDRDQEDLGGPDTLRAFRTKCPAPVVLFVCRESHEVASKVYTRCFPSLGGFPTVWFNYQLDILYFDFFNDEIGENEDALELLNPKELAKVENLCVHSEAILNEAVIYEMWLASLLGLFGGVKSFHAITKHSTHSVLERDLTESEKWDLAIIEVTDIQCASLSSDGRAEAPLPLSGGIYVDINLRLLNECRIMGNEDEEKTGMWELPTIGVGMIVSATIKTDLEHRKCSWEALTALIHSPNRDLSLCYL